MLKFSDLDKIKSNYIWHNKFIFYSFFILLLVNILYLFFNFWIYLGVEEFVPLSYNIYFGVSLVGDWIKLLYIPASGTVILIINTIVSQFLFKREKLLYIVVELTSLIIQIILLVASILLVLSNLT